MQRLGGRRRAEHEEYGAKNAECRPETVKFDRLSHMEQGAIGQNLQQVPEERDAPARDGGDVAVRAPRGASDLANEHRPKAGEIEDEDITGAEGEERGPLVRRRWYFSVKGVLLDTEEHLDLLAVRSGVELVLEPSVRQEDHARVWREVECVVCPDQAPATEQTSLGGKLRRVWHGSGARRRAGSGTEGRAPMRFVRPDGGVLLGVRTPKRRQRTVWCAVAGVLLGDLFQPLLRGLESLGLATMAGIAEERAMLGAPCAVLGPMISDANEVAVRACRGLIDTADARGEIARLATRGLLRRTLAALRGYSLCLFALCHESFPEVPPSRNVREAAG